jgi:hypothetical protein
MTVLPRALVWQRTDTVGGEFVLFDDRDGLTAQGLSFAAMPVKYSVRYELATDPAWVSTHLDLTTEGEGWRRNVRMDRIGGRWRVTTSESGNLNAAVPAAPLAGIEDPDRLAEAYDVAVYDSLLTCTLPIRRLNLLVQPPGAAHTILSAWVALPSLAVLPVENVYTVLDERSIRFASATSRADLTVDDSGFVTNYPRVATR